MIGVCMPKSTLDNSSGDTKANSCKVFVPFVHLYSCWIGKWMRGASVDGWLRPWTVVPGVESSNPTIITWAQLPLCALDQSTSLYLFCASEGTLSHRSHVHVFLTHSVHVKDHHRLFEKEQQQIIPVCWLYVKVLSFALGLRVLCN